MVADLERLSAALVERYALERLLGLGGMATVYLAEDIKHHRRVAIKVLRPELAMALGHERFLREITTTANLRHPHILPLYDSGEADGFLFYVMPFVEGETLGDRIRREKQLPIEEALRIANEVAGALHYAHERGVIHRDIKPDNIMLESGHAVVSDFGIARAVSAAAGSKLTQTGMAIGTPLYMSPEQASGGENVDARSDLYSLACVLYELLAGTPPFTGPTMAVVIARHLMDPVPPLRTARVGVPDYVIHAIERALAKAPADRFPAAEDWIAALTPKPHATPSADPGADGFGAASVSGKDSGDPVHGTARPRETPSEVSIAVLPFADMSPTQDHAYFCEGMAEEIINALVHVEGLRVASRTSAFNAHRDNPDVATLGQRLGVGQILEGSVRTAGNRLRVTAQLIDVVTDRHLWSERYDRGVEDVFAVQDEIAEGVARAVRTHVRAVSPGPGRPLGETTSQPVIPPREPVADLEAYHLYLQGRHLRYAKLDLVEAPKRFEEAVDRDPSYLAARLAIAECYAVAAAYGIIPPRETYGRVNEQLEWVQRQHGVTAEARAIEGWMAWQYKWDPDAAESCLLEAIELDPVSLPARGWYCCLLATRGDRDQLAEQLPDFVRLDPASPWVQGIAGISHLSVGNLGDAIESTRTAIAMEPGGLLGYWVGGLAFGAGEQWDAAIETLDQAARISGRLPAMLAFLGWAEAAGGLPDQARATLKELDDMAAAGRYIDPLFYVYALAELGDWDATRAKLEDAVAGHSALLAWTRLPINRRLRGEPAIADLITRVEHT